MNEKIVYVITTTGKYSWVNHYAIYVTDGKDYNYVYMCTYYLKNKADGCVVKLSWDEFIKGRKVIYYFKTDLTEEQVKQKSCEEYSKKYIGLYYVCGDFTRHITKISPFLTQKNLLLGAIAITAFLIAINWKRT